LTDFTENTYFTKIMKIPSTKNQISNNYQ